MFNCKLCSWCFYKIEREDDFLITKDLDFLHIECYREYDEVIREVEKYRESKSLQIVRELVSEIENSIKENKKNDED